jgi:hypothetical protein
MSSKISEWQKPSLQWHWRSFQEFKEASWFTLGNYANVILLVAVLLIALNQIRLKNNERKRIGYEKRYLRAPEFPEVEELVDFDWKTTEPLQLRPFKPKYHLTMGEFHFLLKEIGGSCSTEKERLTYTRLVFYSFGES